MYSGFLLLLAPSLVLGAKWPYNRYYAQKDSSGRLVADTSRPDKTADERTNHFVHWLHSVSETQDSAEVRSLFLNNTIPRNVSIPELFEYLQPPERLEAAANDTPWRPPVLPNLPSGEAESLLGHLKFPLDTRCTVDRSRWWYRTYDGSCNWLKQGETSAGQMGTAKVRDYNQHAYSDGISKPREGPNPRAVSNALFKRKKTIYYEHTPLLLGLIEWIMHDVSYSMDSDLPEDAIEVPVPDDETYFHENTTFQVWRTKAVPGTGTSKANPRENVNMATTWLDLSSLYGSTPEVGKALRSFEGGRLLTQELKARGESTYASYLPFNTINVPMRTRPGVDPTTLFAGGDPRTNEDWLMLGVHTLFLREHNRLCGILAAQHPEYDDEQLYQTVRVALSAKYALMANSYQMAYWTKDMPWPRDDGFPLYRQMYGKNVLEINPMNTYPWPLVTKAGKPMVVSAEMAIVYRFHEFIISQFPIKDKANNTLWDQDVFATGFNATGFIDTGLENVLRGTVSTHIPNFKSGVDESFRSAGKYRGKPFDIVVWSIVHEREQGLPTFNEYFRAYNDQDPNVEVPIRKTFESFSKDPKAVEDLKRLYKTPDDVDLVVGVQLDEEYFPGTSVPKSALIISLFSLFGMGNSDRFSIGFAATKCFLVDTPWDCHPTNALEELLWAPVDSETHPNFRWLNTFWLTELDFQAHGTNLLWRLITENSNVKCLQQHPLFPADPKTNPIMCTLPKIGTKDTIGTALLSALEVALALYRKHAVLYTTILVAIAGSIAWRILRRRRPRGTPPPVISGWPILGVALSFQKDPRSLLLKGFAQFGETPSKSFGMRLASLTHFVISQPADLRLMTADNPYEAKFSLRSFLAAINFPLITGKDNFESDLHTKLIRAHLSNPETVEQLGESIVQASNKFLQQMPRQKTHLDEFVPTLMKYITSVIGGCIVGSDAQDRPDLLEIFAQFNNDAVQAMGLSSLLPSFLQFIAGWSIQRDFQKARKILVPIVQNRRRMRRLELKVDLTFLDLIVDAVDDDQRAADLVVIIVWGGLTNLQATFTSLVMDITNAPEETRAQLTKDISSLDLSSLKVFDQPSLLSGQGSSQSSHDSEPDQNNPWTPLRAAMFESIRLSGPITGPARIILEDVLLPSSDTPDHPPQTLPQSQVATLSAYHTHRSASAYGADAAVWNPTRFLRANPAIGSPKFVTWGLAGPHMCPGRWFAQECILIMTQCLLTRYDIFPDERMDDSEKYVYTAGSVTRKDVGVTLVVKSLS